MKSDGSVDMVLTDPSPPTREAWIEITGDYIILGEVAGSPPTREAWIEICLSLPYGSVNLVASHPGGVD